MKTRNAGFSRLELIVVIAVFAILSATLLPIFARSREHSQREVCVSNLHKIGLAWRQYARDYDDRAMPVRVRGRDNRGPDKTKMFYWWGSYDGKILREREGLLQPYLKDTRALTCPAFVNFRRRVVGRTGYGYNFDFLSPFGAPRFTVPHSVALSEIISPSRTAVFADAARLEGGVLEGNPFLDVPTTQHPSFHGRHGGAGNVLWADGHVSAQKPVYRRGFFGYNGKFDAALYRKNQLGDLDADGDLSTNELFGLR